MTGLIAARDAAAGADAAKSRFLANMSHELRTPLNAVLAPIDVMRLRLPEGPERAELDAAAVAGVALTDLLTSLVDYARIETGGIDLRPQAVDLRALCEGVAAFGRLRLGTATVTIEVDVSGAPAWVLLDPEAVRQVLLQLMANATQFTSQGRVRLTAQAQGDRLHLTVADTGTGLDVATFETLTRAFEQADTSVTRSDGGLGLGLSIASGLARAMEAGLTAETPPDGGTRICLDLPLQGAEAPRAPAEPQAQDPGETGLCVLAVDDNPANLAVLQAILVGLGAGTVCVTDGAQAVAAAAGRRFDYILMDVQMPVMDGLTAIRHIRSAERTESSRVPIIVISANVSRADVDAAHAAGADDVLGKPVNPAALITAMMACQPVEVAA